MQMSEEEEASEENEGCEERGDVVGKEEGSAKAGNEEEENQEANV